LDERGLEIGVLADDLAGALASAARLRQNGLRAEVLWREVDVPATADALVVDMQTRDRDVAPAREARRWAGYLRAAGCRRFELRTDSTLRGSPAAELEGMLDGLCLVGAVVLAVPAFPDAGRVTIDGRQRVRGSADARQIDVADRLFGASPVTAIDVGRVDAGSRAVHESIRDSRRNGIRNFVADATEDRHLVALADAAALVEADGVDLVTVSPGAWLRYHPTTVSTQGTFVLVVVSSATDENRRQLDRLVAAVPCAVVDVARAASGHIRLPDGSGSGRRAVVLETATAQPGAGGSASPSFCVEAAKAAAALLEASRRSGWRCAGVVVSGGFTAACLVDELGAERARAVVEPSPLCGAGRLVGGGWDGLPVITKGGLVGDDSALHRLVDSMWDGWDDG
jgi:uncharacterized protein YgbK (DUF1537 family)